MFGLRNELIISISLSKPNTIHAVQQFATIPGTFAPMLSQLKRERYQFPRTIIYCRRFEDCADIYLYFRNQIGVKFTEPTGASNTALFQLLDMYMSCTEQTVKEEVLKRFTQESKLCIVVYSYCCIWYGGGLS